VKVLPRFLVHTPLRKAFDDVLVGDVEVDDGGERRVVLFQKRRQPLGLLEGARVAVEDEAREVFARDGFLGQRAHNLVGHQLAGVDERLRLLAHGRLRLDGLANDDAGREMAQAAALRQETCLRAFPRAGRAKESDAHVVWRGDSR